MWWSHSIHNRSCGRNPLHRRRGTERRLVTCLGFCGVTVFSAAVVSFVQLPSDATHVPLTTSSFKPVCRPTTLMGSHKATLWRFKGPSNPPGHGGVSKVSRGRRGCGMTTEKPRRPNWVGHDIDSETQHHENTQKTRSRVREKKARNSHLRARPPTLRTPFPPSGPPPPHTLGPTVWAPPPTHPHITPHCYPKQKPTSSTLETGDKTFLKTKCEKLADVEVA